MRRRIVGLTLSVFCAAGAFCLLPEETAVLRQAGITPMLSSAKEHIMRIENPNPEVLSRALPLFRDTTGIRLSGELPPLETLLALREANPELDIHWEISYADRLWDDTVTEMVLDGVNLDNMKEFSECISRLPMLERVVLKNTDLPQQRLLALARRWPDLNIAWEMKFHDKRFYSDVTELDLSGIRVSGAEEVEALLPSLPKLQKVIMSGCGLSNEEMDALNRRHENIRFVWTVKLGPLSVRTDETWFMPVKHNVRVETKDLVDLKYCTDMICIDIGHMWVHNCDWAAYMPNLQYLIIGETYITDLSPLAGLKNLKYLELFTIKVDDYTPLLTCTGMEDLNLGLTYGDPDVIAQMTWLKNLWWCDANGYNAPGRREKVSKMIDALPNTQIMIYIDHPTASGWRRLPNYYKMRDILGMYYMD